MKVWTALPAIVLFAAACNCGVQPNGTCATNGDCVAGQVCLNGTCVTAGSDAGNTPDGATVGDAGGTPDSGTAGDAGSTCTTSGSITPDQICARAYAGARWDALQTTTQCGQPITDSDLDHIDISQASASNGPDAGDAGNVITVGPVPGIVLDVIGGCGDGGLLQAFSANLVDSISAGRVCFDAQLLDSCRTEIQALKDAGILFDAGAAFGDGGPYANCLSGILHPNVPNGGACQHDFDCMAGTFCNPSGPGSCAGTCTSYLQLGDTCSRNRVCDPSLACTQTANGPTCLRTPDAGPGSCATSGSCGNNQDCVGTPGNQQCVPRAGLGQPCSLNLDTAPGCLACLFCGPGNTCQLSATVGQGCSTNQPCAPYLECDTTNPLNPTCKLRPRTGEVCKVGTPKTSAQYGDCLFADNFCSIATPGTSTGVCATFPARGSPCGFGTDVWPSCASGSDFCQITAGSTGICAARLGSAQSCSFTSQCADGLYCARTGSSGTCTALPITGQPCTSAVGCAVGNWCLLPDAGANGTCEALLTAGATCSDSTQCASALCEKGQCIVPCQPPGGASPGCSGGCDGCKQGLQLVTLFLIFSTAANFRRRKRTVSP